jgi:hypothetical protein
MKFRRSNERTSGNGAVALWFHIDRLSRAVPECERWPFTGMKSLLFSAAFAVFLTSCASRPPEPRPVAERELPASYFCWFVERDPEGHQGYAYYPGLMSYVPPEGFPRHTINGYIYPGFHESIADLRNSLVGTSQIAVKIIPRYPSAVPDGWSIRALSDEEEQSLR